jgi:hypothetical protein
MWSLQLCSSLLKHKIYPSFTDCVSGPVAQHTNDSINIEDADYLFNMEIEHDDLSAAAPNLTWDQLVVRALHVVRCREFTEYNSKTGLTLPTRFCRYNIVFFDHDKECEQTQHLLV